MTHLILQEWKLEIINLKKTKITAFHQRKILKSNFYSRHDVIEQVHKFEYLGVIFFHKMAISPLPEKIRICNLESNEGCKGFKYWKGFKVCQAWKDCEGFKGYKGFKGCKDFEVCEGFKGCECFNSCKGFKGFYGLRRVSIVARGSRVAWNR